MVSPQDLTLYRRAFVDVCRGYSIGRSKDGTEVYVRHLSHFEHQEYDLLQARFEEQAAAQGAQTEAQRLDQLYAKALWSPAREEEIQTKRDTIARAEEARKNIALPSVLRGHEEHITRERSALVKMLTERARLVGETTETYASRRLEDYYLACNLFTDSRLTNPLCPPEVFDGLDDDAVDAIREVYREAIEPCSDANLRKLAAQDLFVSYYALAPDNPQACFGKPAFYLTYYQVRLLNAARYVKALLDNTDLSKLTPDQRNDPDALERVHTTQKNMEKMQAEGKVPVGMSSADIKATGTQFSPLPPPNLSGVELVRWMQKNNVGR